MWVDAEAQEKHLVLRELLLMAAVVAWLCHCWQAEEAAAEQYPCLGGAN